MGVISESSSALLQNNSNLGGLFRGHFI